MLRSYGSSRTLSILLLASIWTGLPAADDPSTRLDEYVALRQTEILHELELLLRVPNVATDLPNLRRNAGLLVTMLESRGATARLLELADDVPPVVLGELPAAGARRTVVFYAHYDGQPVEPSRWSTPPWEPTLKSSDEGDRRLYARSASDDKAPIVAMLAAIDALSALGIARSVNLKFFFEGEEEAGSPHLRQMLETHRDLLDADLWLFCDGPKHPSRRTQVVFGVRGITGVELTTYGPLRPLHSGHYGNWAPNPAAELAHLLATMRAADGTITIEGIAEHVRPLTETDRAAIAAAPDTGEAMRHALGLGRSEADNAPILERITQPALNVRGLSSGKTGGESKNAIPATATASLGFRLVPDLTPEIVRRAVVDHLTRHGYQIVHQEPDLSTRLSHPRIVRLDWSAGYRALRTNLDLPASVALLRLLDRAADQPVIRLPILGGSLPLYIFDEVLQTPLIVLPIVNHDNNQHAPNENLRLDDLWEGIVEYALVMAQLGQVWP